MEELLLITSKNISECVLFRKIFDFQLMIMNKLFLLVLMSAMGQMCEMWSG